MILPTVSDATFRAAQAATLATLALWIGIGQVPGFRRHMRVLRGLILAAYLAGMLGFIGYAFIQR